MAISEPLEVHLGHRHVGTLSRENGRLAFRYGRQWLDDPGSHPLSLSRPLRKASFADAETIGHCPWFQSLSASLRYKGPRDPPGIPATTITIEPPF
jgi:HipA-like protein